MNMNETLSTAQSVAMQIIESNSFVSPEDTVCAVRARSGRIYTGLSRTNMTPTGPVMTHAEIEAVGNMQASGEFIVDEIVLISTQTGYQLLPCANCLGYIASLNPENANAAIIMPDRMIRISETGAFAPQQGMGMMPDQQFAQPGMMPDQQYGAPQGGYMGNPSYPPQNGGFYGGAPAGMPQNDFQQTNIAPGGMFRPQSFDEEETESVMLGENSNGDMLKNRVHDLLKYAEDEEDEEETKSDKPAKKGLFGLFRK